jgi:hypothetical protein
LIGAAIVAGLLHPIVAGLWRSIPGAIALLVVVLVTVGTIGGLVHATVDDLSRDAAKLQQAAPDAARKIEASARFGEAAHDFELTDRVTEFVNALPDRIAGGATGACNRRRRAGSPTSPASSSRCSCSCTGPAWSRVH